MWCGASLSGEETLMVLVASWKMGWRCTEGASSWLIAGDQGRLSLVPAAGWAAEMGWEGGDRGWCQWGHWRGRGRVVLQAVSLSLCARFGVHVLKCLQQIRVGVLMGQLWRWVWWGSALQGVL